MENITINEDFKKHIENFINKTKNLKKRIALITSGGCSVRLEKNTVRTIENFSTGTRGALSAEEFLKRGYNVIFFFRDRSNQPFIHKLDPVKLVYDEEYFHSDKVKTLREEAKKYSENILYIKFNTFEEYIEKLYPLCQCVSALGKESLIYLAAAISDFIIPEKLLSEHKIQSKDDKGSHFETLELTLYPAPKEIYKIKEVLNKDGFLITFKLETDEGMLKKKALQALEKCKSDLVVGNILQKRYDEINLFLNNILVKYRNKIEDKLKSKDSLESEERKECFDDHELLLKSNYKDICNIEEVLINRLVELHSYYIKDK